MNSVPGDPLRWGVLDQKNWFQLPCDCTGGLFSHSLIEHEMCQPESTASCTV